MRESERRSDSQEKIKQKIRNRYKGVDRSEIEFIPAKEKEKLFEDTAQKRVCAYCRVSTDDAKQTSSYELQKNHYEEMIKEHEGWALVDLYADEGISGTSLQRREDFKRMIIDCKAGKIDLVVTKSVSRFARNIVDCIAKVRELANLAPPVGVFFETEHIYTLDNTSEMMLAVLSAAAQEESHTKSEIMNISIEQRFSRGIFLTPKLLGYDLDDEGELVINESEAETVKLCYYLLLSGYTAGEIADVLTELERPTKIGNTKWSSSSVIGILQNERYCGDVLGRKTFTPNYLNHKSKKNNHDRNQYLRRDHHEAIVTRKVFNAAKKLIASAKYRTKGYPLPTLQVIDEGALKGFVPVNRTWSGFSSGDYKVASQSVYEQITDSSPVMTVEADCKKSHFDLSGFQIARAQFFSTRQNPAMTLSNGKLSFNTSCLRKFENVEYVELLFNSVEQCMAIRPTAPDNPNAIKWCSIKNGKMVVLPKSCSGFAEPLFEMMDWNEECRYRFRGQYQAMDDEQIMIFDLEEPEVLKKEIIEDEGDALAPETNGKTDAPKEEVSKRKKYCDQCLYPTSWSNDFGNDVGSKSLVILHRIHYNGDWDVLRPAKAVEVCNDFTPEDIENFTNIAERMMVEMRWIG